MEISKDKPLKLLSIDLFGALLGLVLILLGMVCLFPGVLYLIEATITNNFTLEWYKPLYVIVLGSVMFGLGMWLPRLILSITEDIHKFNKQNGV